MRTSWQQRLLALTVAGGGIAAAAACSVESSHTDVAGGGACNANPDPCCGRIDGPNGFDVCKNNVTVSGPNSMACRYPADGTSRDACCGMPDSATCKLGHTITTDAGGQCNANPDPCCGQPDGLLVDSPKGMTRTCQHDMTVSIVANEDAGSDAGDAAPE